MAAALTAWSASAQLYVTGASVKVGSQTNSWDAKNALQCAVEGDYYTFEANGEFTISTVKADWDDGWKTGTYTLNGNWNTTSTSATASLQRVDGNIPAAKIGETVTYKVKKDFSTIEASFSAAEVKTYYFLHGQITGDPNWKSVALTQEGDNYKYTGNLVAGEFGVKICSDPSGADWSQTAWIGGAANITEANKSYSFVDGANSKSTLAGEYTIVYNQTAKTIEFKTDGGDTPTPPVPAGKDLYLVGTFNGWQPGDANYKMTQNGDTYTISVPALDVNAETNDVQFKIAYSTWEAGSFGAEGDPNATEALPVDITLGSPMNAWKGSGCNFRSAVALTNVTVTFVLSSDASVASTLTVTADGGDTPTPPVPTPTDLYLVGNFNGWQPGDANYKMTQDGDTYTISIPALTVTDPEEGVQFKVSGTTWDDPSYGAEGDPNATEALPVDVTLNTPMNAWAGSGCNFKLTESLTNVNITFILSSDATLPSQLTVAGQSAIEAVEAAAVEATAEYYNLQGIRVLEPEAGQLYIVNRDGKVSKEIAR